MALYTKLKNTPIKEIIFIISFNGDVSLSQLEDFINIKSIRERFPTVNRGFHTEITKTNDEPPKSTSLLEGFLIRSQSPSRIIHVKRGSLAFHKVNGYEPFENLYAEISEYWELFKGLTKVETISNLSIRYVNFIETDANHIDDLLSIKLNHPFPPELDAFFTQMRFRYEPNPTIDVNVVVSKARDGKKEGVVLDIILNKKVASEVGVNQFLDMREAKNSIFFSCITEGAINKFNQ